MLQYCPDCSERLRYDHITRTLYCIECELEIRLTPAVASAMVGNGRDRGFSRSRALAVIKG